MFQSRTHNCGELRLCNAGEAVTLAGWLENVREVGSNFAFCVLRDYYGTTQVVIENAEMMSVIKGITKESTIQVTGVVRERESKNKKQVTGEIEVVPTEIKVLGKCRHNQLPFEINKSKDADENTRLKYRYLDLRNPMMGFLVGAPFLVLAACTCLSSIATGILLYADWRRIVKYRQKQAIK